MASADLNMSSTAISLEVPDAALLSIEHPGVVKNAQNAIASLGGDKTVSKVRCIVTTSFALVNLHMLNPASSFSNRMRQIDISV